MASKPPIPEFPSQWRARAKKLKILDIPMSKLGKLDSASKMTEEQFICLRVIWPKPKEAKDFPAFDEAINTRVANMMDNFPPFDLYLSHLRSGTRTSDNGPMGVFQMVMQAQLKVSTDRKVPGIDSDSVIIQRSVSVQNQSPSVGRTLRSSRARTSTPGSTTTTSDTVSTGVTTSIISIGAASDVPFRLTGDEIFVNEALLALLRALTVHLPGIRCEWSSGRSPFIKTSFGESSMTARIDGSLMAMDTPDIFAIIEVKPRVRDRRKWPQLLWQESAEMVSWILHDKCKVRMTPVGRRLLVSQDNHEIWLTIAKYDEEYIQYLRDELPTQQPVGSKRNSDSAKPWPFMRMHQYGPWNIQSASSMRGLARIIVGLIFKVTDDITSGPRVN